MRKQGRKTGDLINEKPLNLIRKQEGKPIIYCFAGGENPPKSSQKNGRGKSGAY